MKNLSNMSFCSDFGHGASYLHVDVLKNTQIPRTCSDFGYKGLSDTA
jgi:hypothetical protein